MQYPVATDRRHQLGVDMARDPESIFTVSIGGDRMLPPWFGSDGDSRPPDDIADRLFCFLRDQCNGIEPTEWELRHNWVDRQIEFVRWCPEFTPAAGRAAIVTWNPIELLSWPETEGWLPHGVLDQIWQSMVPNEADTSARDAKHEEIESAKLTVQRLSTSVATGRATPLEIEEFEAALKIADPDSWAESYETAKEAVPIFRQLMDDLGV